MEEQTQIPAEMEQAEETAAPIAAEVETAPQDAENAAQAELETLSEPEQTPAPQRQMVTVVDIRFRNNAKTYFFDPGEWTVQTGDHVVIDTARGDEFGYCAAGNHLVDVSEIVPPLRKVLRLATARDEKINADNQEKEKKAFEVCQQKIAEHKLDMQLVSAECAFDGSKILFFFTADGRVDFRELVKNLASVFRTRIELRQIGVRDKAKMVGGLGVCGRPFCCKEFLDDFQPVSIKMAKTQNLSLNPTKISGTCGRLMCCLKYEQEAYEDLLRTSPKGESFVDTPDGRGTVTDVSLLRQSVKVRMEQHPETVNCYHNCDICVLRNGKAKKTDPPIPADLAPISSKPRAARPKPAELEAMPEVIYPDEVRFVSARPSMELPAEPAELPTQGLEAPAENDESKNGGRRRRKRGRGKPQGTPDVSGEAAPQPKPQNDRKPKPQSERKPQGEPKPQPSAAPEAREPRNDQASRRRYRRRPAGGNGAGSPPKAE